MLQRSFAILRSCLPLVAGGAMAEERQNPSPMVEHTRAHERLPEAKPNGVRIPVEPGTFFLPEKVDRAQTIPLLVFFHGGAWLPEVAAERAGCAVLGIQAGPKSGGYAAMVSGPGRLRGWLDAARAGADVQFSSVTLGGWSAGGAAIRELLKDAESFALVDRVVCIDGMHTAYPDGGPGPRESKIDSSALAPWLAFAREATAGRKRLLITHTEIFPGTFASTTETADWLLGQLGMPRRAVLEWGPRGAQQLSEARLGGFLLHGYAGNSAPDHVDLLHALPECLGWLERVPNEGPAR